MRERFFRALRPAGATLIRAPRRGNGGKARGQSNRGSWQRAAVSEGRTVAAILLMLSTQPRGGSAGKACCPGWVLEAGR